jgi:signal transduction histidine kinase
MTEEDLKKLFKPNFRTTDQNSLSLNKMSHGLGLSICKMIAEKINGKIKAESVWGEGSTFTFTLNVKMPPKDPNNCMTAGEIIKNRAII